MISRCALHRLLFRALLALCLGLASGLAGCESKKTGETTSAQETAPATWAITKLDLSSASPQSTPLSKQVEAMIREKLTASPRWTLEPEVPHKATMRVEYATTQGEGPTGEELIVGVVIAELEELGGGEDQLRWSYRKTETLPLPKDNVESERAALIERQIDELVKSMSEVQRLHDASKEELVAILKAEELTDHALLHGAQRIRDEKIPETEPLLRELLDHESPEVVLMAAGVLSMRRDVKSSAKMVEAATRLSRNGHIRAYIASLYMLGDLGGEPAEQYLATAAEGHPSEEVQKIAAQSLGRIRSRKVVSP